MFWNILQLFWLRLGCFSCGLLGPNPVLLQGAQAGWGVVSWITRSWILGGAHPLSRLVHPSNLVTSGLTTLYTYPTEKNQELSYLASGMSHQVCIVPHRNPGLGLNLCGAIWWLKKLREGFSKPSKLDSPKNFVWSYCFTSTKLGCWM